MSSSRADDTAMSGRGENDGGFTLVELLIVIVILGVLATVVVASVEGITDRGEQASCDDDQRILRTAVESYFAHQGGATIAATGSDGDRFERTLMDAGFVTAPSQLWDIDVDGKIVTVAGSRCT